ncbi:MAG TPA: NUDIX hydrolase [Acidimicrobiales bacterium]|nr:NUDIX hydrolase [Acidimicrobiales bacterium]
MKRWLVAGAVIEGAEGVLLVANRRHNGAVDWSTPGGVIDEGEDVMSGLAREVQEETGLVVARWDGLLYGIEVEAPDLGWHLRVEVHRAGSVEGELAIDDPDGIVFDAGYVAVGECDERLAQSQLWVREPLSAWLGQRWTLARDFKYHVAGSDLASLRVSSVL